MKKLTLEKTWTECLRMWRWIAKVVRAGSRACVDDLKVEWMERHSYKGNVIESNCFFCQYVRTHSKKCKKIEGSCPAQKVDPEFNCFCDDYSYDDKPIAFYNKLVALNRKRKKK